MLSVGLPFFLSLSIFLLVAGFTSFEKRRGRRLLLAGLRGGLDTIIVRVNTAVARKFHYLLRHIIKLSWYYSIHSMLSACMTILVKAYDRLEEMFLANRDRARKLRAEKRSFNKDNHLTVMAEHKVSTALTTSQKKKLREKKLEGK